MQSNSCSILIVDDTKYSSAVVNRLLHNEGFTDIRTADSAIDALTMMKERNADILLADWLMPGMDGLALTQLVRELNRRQNKFTYVVLLTAKEGNEDLKEAFAKGVDDFIGKTTLKSHLIPRIHAAQRIAVLHNSLLKRELKLKDQYRTLSLMNRIDPVTNVGNMQFLEQQLDRYLEEHKGRHGHIGLLLCRLDNLQEHQQQYGEQVKNQLLKLACERLRTTGRPLDDIARIDENTLALGLYGKETSFITHKLIRRVQDALLTKAYSTDAGFCSLTGTLQYEVIDANGNAPHTAQEVISGAIERLQQLVEGQSIHFWEQSDEPKDIQGDEPKDESKDIQD